MLRVSSSGCCILTSVSTSFIYLGSEAPAENRPNYNELNIQTRLHKILADSNFQRTCVSWVEDDVNGPLSQCVGVEISGGGGWATPHNP